MGDLHPVLIDLEVAERRSQLELQELLAHLVRVDASGSLDGFREDQAPGVARRREVRRLAFELGLEALDELAVSRVAQHRLPLGGAVDVFGGALQRVVELRQIAADRDAVHFGD